MTVVHGLCVCTARKQCRVLEDTEPLATSLLQAMVLCVKPYFSCKSMVWFWRWASCISKDFVAWISSSNCSWKWEAYFKSWRNEWVYTCSSACVRSAPHLCLIYINITSIEMCSHWKMYSRYLKFVTWHCYLVVCFAFGLFFFFFPVIFLLNTVCFLFCFTPNLSLNVSNN